MKCPGCGIETNAKICESCGTVIESTILATPARPVAPAAKKPIFKNWWFWVIIVVVIFGAANSGKKSDNNASTSSTQSQDTKKSVSKDNSVSSKPTVKSKPTSKPVSASVSSNKVEWKQFLKEYEEWVDSYVALVKKYKANTSDMSILSEYTTMMQKLVVWSEKADKVEKELKNNSAALKEYLSTLTRVIKKLSSVY